MPSAWLCCFPGCAVRNSLPSRPTSPLIDEVVVHLRNAGIDSTKLAEGLQTIRQKNFNVYSLLLIRNGLVVADTSYYPYDGKTVHELASVTKSLMTTLIVIAAYQGMLRLDQRMVSSFPERNIANRDARKERITSRHRAGMSSGLDSVGFSRDEGNFEEKKTGKEWVQFALDRKVGSDPGTRFLYDSPWMHLLSAILQKATRMTALKSAGKNLFDPLGIREVMWPDDPQGFNHGWGEVGGKYADVKRRGQRVVVFPALNIFVVTTGGGFRPGDVTDLLKPALVDLSKPLSSSKTRS